MDIDKLEAGPELDMLIAERVMGWRWYHLSAMGGNWINELKSGLVLADYLPGKTHAKYQAPYTGPRYSTDIAAAFLVVNEIHRMIERDEIDDANYLTLSYSGISRVVASFDCNLNDDEGWYESINMSSLLYSADASTVPLSICRAALAAVMEGA